MIRRFFLLLLLTFGLTGGAFAGNYADRWCLHNTDNGDFPVTQECSTSMMGLFGMALEFANNEYEAHPVQLPFQTTRYISATPGECKVIPKSQGIYPRGSCQFKLNYRDVDNTTGAVTNWQSTYLMEIWMTCGEQVGGGMAGGWDAAAGVCRRYMDQEQPKCKQCQVGNPVTPMDGIKHQIQPILRWGRGHKLEASYSFERFSVGNGTNFGRGGQSFGDVWFSNFHKHAYYAEFNSWAFGYNFQRENGKWKSFTQFPDNAALSSVELDSPPIQSGANLLYFDSEAEAIEVFSPMGSDYEISAIHYIDGRRVNYSYGSAPGRIPEDMAKELEWDDASDTRLLRSVTDEAGRSVTFTYEATVGRPNVFRIKSARAPDGSETRFLYLDKRHNMLATLVFPDLTERNYSYGPQPGLISKLIDEQGQTYGTYEYDNVGRAVMTKTGSNGPAWRFQWTQAPTWNFTETLSDNVVRRNFSFDSPTSVRIFGPDGYEETMNSTQISGSTVLGSRVIPAGSGSPASSIQLSYDAYGNVTRRIDANGTQSCYAYAAARHIEIARVEGLSNDTDCASALSMATLPADSRKVSTQWHPDWRKQTRIAEPGRITTLVYNGQPDPTNGGATASCAPSTALLPNNKPLVLLCKRVEVATTDTTGASGFNAAAHDGTAARTWSWIYNAHGQVLTETDSRGKTVVTNAYYDDAAADHMPGDLQSSTNALGHVTRFLRYNAMGQPVQVVDPNGISTVYTYDARQRIKSVTVADAMTSYDYWPTGYLKKAALPDGSFVAYEYDDAHRMTAATDSLGNRVEYTLDQRGNRTAETVKDPSGALKRSMARVFDALSRIQQSTGE